MIEIFPFFVMKTLHCHEPNFFHYQSGVSFVFGTYQHNYILNK